MQVRGVACIASPPVPDNASVYYRYGANTKETEEHNRDDQPGCHFNFYFLTPQPRVRVPAAAAVVRVKLYNYITIAAFLADYETLVAAVLSR
jgi:hypothetical protein